MPKKVVKEDPRPSFLNKDRAKKNKVKDNVKKDLPNDLRDSFDTDPQIVLLHAILRELQK